MSSLPQSIFFHFLYSFREPFSLSLSGPLSSAMLCMLMVMSAWAVQL